MAVWSDRSSGRNPPSTILVGAPLLLGQGFRGLLVAAALAERAHRLPLLSPRGASSASVRRRNLDKGLFDCLQGELEAREKPPGLSMSDLLTLPEPLGGVLNWMLRQEVVTFAEVMAFLAQEEEQTRALLADLYHKGFVREIEIRGVTCYRVRQASKRGRALPSNLWQALDEKVDQGEGEQR